MRIFTGSLASETNTFSPVPTGWDAFRVQGYFPSGTHPEHLSFFAAPLWVARQAHSSQQCILIEGLVAAAQPGGKVTRLVYERLRDELLDDLRRALPVQLVLLGLHGAMVAEGYDDCEGDLLHRTRQIVGPDVVISAELDPHAHLSELMTRNADLLIAFKEYPHTDVVERARELLELSKAAVQGSIHPVCAVADCGMIATIHTTREPARAFIDRIRKLERRTGVLSISIIHGFGYGDVPEMGTKVLVYTDGDYSLADRLARSLAVELIAMREQLTVPYVGIDEALDLALAAPAAPVVLADRADNPGSGAPGDSTFILSRMLERGISNAAVGPLSDPLAVRVAFEAGVGARLTLRIGGKVGPASGMPLDLHCEVKALHPKMTMTGLSGAPMPVGDAALVVANEIEIVLITLRNQAMSTDVFAQLGCDLSSKAIVVVKSAQHFRASFSTIAKSIIHVAAPGAATPYLACLSYKKIRRPKWPVDL